MFLLSLLAWLTWSTIVTTRLHLKLSDNVNIAATLHIYSAAGDALLHDNTIIYTVTKVYAPAGQPVELNAF
jgi:hypothetical protein